MTSSSSIDYKLVLEFEGPMPKLDRGAPAKIDSLLIALDEITRRGIRNGTVQRGHADRIRDAIATDWGTTRPAVDKHIERWGASAEGLAQAIFAHNKAWTPAHVVEALSGWRGQATPRPSASSNELRRLHVVAFSLDSYFKALVHAGRRPTNRA